MSIERKLIGEPERYKGRLLTVRHMGPDVLGYVDDTELSGFFLNPEAARAAGRRHVDAELKAAAEEKRKKERAA